MNSEPIYGVTLSGEVVAAGQEPPQSTPTVDTQAFSVPAVYVFTSGVQVSQSIVYSSNSTLSEDVYAVNVTINSGVTVSTNGYNFYCSGNFVNNGTIDTGTNPNSFLNLTSSYGGSGAGGGSGQIQGGAAGNSTTAPGGAGGTGGGNGAAGNSATFPLFSNSLIQLWVQNGTTNYLGGVAGGIGGIGGNGGAGSYGLLVQAQSINAGTIVSTGASGAAGSSGGGGGGGGGGSLVFVYQTTYVAGSYTLTGGTGGSSPFGAGGTGGSGIASSYQYTIPPIFLSPNVFDYDLNVTSITILASNANATDGVAFINTIMLGRYTILTGANLLMSVGAYSSSQLTFNFDYPNTIYFQTQSGIVLNYTQQTAGGASGSPEIYVQLIVSGYSK